MAKMTRENLLARMFQDPKNYPYGFSRSGDFSIAEAKALASYGTLIEALLMGNIEASNDEDKSFIAVARGEKDPSTVTEKAWSKYQNRIHRTKTGSIYGRSSANDDGDDSGSIDDDEPLDTNIDMSDEED